MVRLTGIQMPSWCVRRKKPSWEWKMPLCWPARLNALAAALAFHAEQRGRRLAEEVGVRKPAQPLGHRVGRQQLVGVRVEEEQGIPCLLEQRLGEFSAVGGHRCDSALGGGGRREVRTCSSSTWYL